jgi:hypothetical protein
MSTTKVQSDMVDIDGATTATIATGDKINFLDITDSLVKEDTVQGILDLAGGGFTLGTDTATASGTSFTFGSIPTGTTMIIIMFEGVSLSGSDDLAVQIGDSGGIETSGYIANGHSIDIAVASKINSTAHFPIKLAAGAHIVSGIMTLSLKDSSNFTWVQGHTVKASTDLTNFGAGEKSLSAELTQVHLTRSGSDTFDAGSVNIMYQ